jgi:drug/metabolite transporter (DMT)-like permease
LATRYFTCELLTPNSSDRNLLEPDFAGPDGKTVCRPIRTLLTGAKIAELDVWWDSARIRNGTIWDDPHACSLMLSAQKAAHRTLVEEVRALAKQLSERRLLSPRLRRRLLILSLLIAYLEERSVLLPADFNQAREGSGRFFEILGDGPALIALLEALEERFNGHVFKLKEEDRAALLASTELASYARLVEGYEDSSGQLSLWRLYSFRDLAQLILLRSTVAALLLALWILPVQGMSGLRLARPGRVWARSLCLAAMWLSYFAALPAMSFALAAAFYYTAPAWMALLGRVFLGMTIGARGWFAVALSLTGVLLAVAPSADRFTPLLLLPLAAAVFYALAGLITWSRCQEESPGAMALTLSLCLVCVAATALVFLWLFGPGGTESFILAIRPQLTLADWSLVFVLGCLLAVIATAVATAYRVAPTPVVGVFDTAYLGFAAVWGVVFFGDAPTPRETLGIALIACSAIVMSSRRQKRKDEYC